MYSNISKRQNQPKGTDLNPTDYSHYNQPKDRECTLEEVKSISKIKANNREILK